MFKRHETVDRTLFVRAKKSKSFKYPLTCKWMSKEEQNTNVCYNMRNLKNLMLRPQTQKTTYCMIV